MDPPYLCAFVFTQLIYNILSFAFVLLVKQKKNLAVSPPSQKPCVLVGEKKRRINYFITSPVFHRTAFDLPSLFPAPHTKRWQQHHSPCRSIALQPPAVAAAGFLNVFWFDLTNTSACSNGPTSAPRRSRFIGVRSGRLLRGTLLNGKQQRTPRGLPHRLTATLRDLQSLA